MTRKKFKLNNKEKVQRKILNIIIVFIVLIIIKGIYNQSNNIDQDNILFPFFLILSIIFCAIYSFNAFTSGNIVRNWSSIRIFTTIYNYLKGKRNFSDEKAIKISTNFFGIFTLTLIIICIAVGIYSLYTGKW